MATGFPAPIYDPIAAALAEDLGKTGDLTVRYFVQGASDQQSKDSVDSNPVKATIVAREPLVVSGIDVAKEVFRRIDPNLAVEACVSDGRQVLANGKILKVVGAAGSILTAERTALNFLQRLSGIATLTRQYVDAIGDLPVQMLDTRKTTPGLRALEKAAVISGGGKNHRFGLFDRVMMKDNHLLAGANAGDVTYLQSAIDRFHTEHPDLLIEFEADTLAQVDQFIGLKGVDWILLDNMSCDDLRAAVELRRKSGKKVRLEASGGINLKTVRKVAETGVDAISVGALTHSARAVDLSLDFVPV